MRKGVRLAVLVAVLLFIVLDTVGMVYLNHKRIADEQYLAKMSQLNIVAQENQLVVDKNQVIINKAQDVSNQQVTEFDSTQNQINAGLMRALGIY